MNRTELVVIGGGGFGREVLWLASECRQPFRVRGVLDDGLVGKCETVGDVPMLGGLDRWRDHQAECAFVIAVGSPRTRRSISKRMVAEGSPEFATLVHRSVEMSRSVTIGRGSMICARSVITVDASIGAHAILNLGVTVGHDCRFDDLCTLAPMVAVSGNVSLGQAVEVGTAASIREGISIGDGAMVGMGAVVVKDVAPLSLVLGSPAVPKRDLEPL